MNSLLLSLVLFFNPPHTQALNQTQVDVVQDVSVMIRAKQYSVNPFSHKVEYGMSGCSGTYIDSYKVLTAAHCFGEPTLAIWVKDSKETKSHTARLVKMDKDLDLAILEVKAPKGHRYAVINSTAPKVGEQVITVGSPFNFQFLLAEGIVSKLGYKSKEFKATYLVHTAMINPGSSGGGLFNSKGELIGVNTMTAGSPFGFAGISMAVDAATIDKFVSDKVDMESFFKILFGI